MKLSRGFVLVLAFATASIANAQNTVEADKLFDKGKQLMAENKLAEACTAFEESQRLAAATTTEMNLANCREKNDQLATAHALFMHVAKELESKPESKKLREVALQRAATLQPRISKLTLIVPAASQVRDLQIQLAPSVSTVPINEPIPLDGGTYTVTARAPDRIEWTTTIVIAPSGDTKTIEVPALADANPQVPVKREPTTSSGGSLKLPIIFGVAALGLGAAAIGLELAGQSKYKESEDAFYDRELQLKLLDEANARHIPAQILGVAAVGCAAAAIIFFVTRDKPTESSSVSMVPVTSPTSVGLAAFATW